MQGVPFTSVGRTIKTHGLNGEVSVELSIGASPSSLVGLEIWFVPPVKGVRSARVTGERHGSKGPLLAFEGISTIDAARAVCGRGMLVRTEDVPADADVASDIEIEGYRVVDGVRGDIGEIVETIVTGANDVWVVHGRLGEVLIPVIDDVVLAVDDDTRTIAVKLLDGLIEEDE